MLILNHLIKDTEIIGIGPLYYQPSKDPAMWNLYKSFCYVFDIHTKRNSIEIKSDFFKPEMDDKEKTRAKKYEDDYYGVRKEIAKLIGEEHLADQPIS